MGKLPFRGRLIVVTGLILVFGFLTTNLISFQVSTRALKATILQNELPLTSSNTYAEIQTDLLRPVFVSSLMSNDTFVKDWLLGGEQDLASVKRYLEEISKKYDVFTTFLISDKSRKYYHFSGVIQEIDEKNPDDAWFFRTKAMKEPYEINIDINKALNTGITIFVNYKVLDYDGNFIAVTGVGLKLETVANIVERYRGNQARNIYFLDKTGQITVRSSGALVGDDDILKARGISAIAPDILKNEQGFYEYERDGETLLMTTRFIPELGWHVVVEQKEADALKELWRSFYINLGIGLIIVILTIAAISYAIYIYQKRLEEMAITDKLTGLGNRQLFDLTLEQAIKMQRRAARPFSVIIFDIDHFKNINDTRGHLTGDEVIKKLAQAAKAQIRNSDLFCRWGGEEFIVLAYDCPEIQAMEVAEKLRSAIAMEALIEPDDGLRATISVGLTTYQGYDDMNSILRRADAALYRAKEDGRNCVKAM